MALTDYVWKRISDALLRIYSTYSLPDAEQTALRCVANLIPCSSGAIYLMDQDDTGKYRYSDMVYVGEEPRYWKEYVERDLRNDPYYRGLELPPTTIVYRYTDALSEEDRLNSPLTQQIYEPMGIGFGLHALLVYEGKEVGEINIYRKKTENDFSDTSFEILSILAPHVALHLARMRLVENRKENGRDERSMPRIPHPIEDRPELSGNNFEHDLTKREMEVLGFAAEGLSDSQIARTLYIAESTVKKHIHNGYGKLGVKNRIQLRKALEKRGYSFR